MPPKNMPWRAAIDLVLRERGVPMPYLAITAEILERGLRESFGSTPSYTVAANLSEDAKRGDASQFVRVETGIYGLREWLGPGADGTAAPGPVATEPSVPDAPDEPALTLAPGAPRIAVRAYGMYWERDLIEWSRGTPRLLGQQYQNSDVVDHSEQRGLYVLYDHRTVVYVGRAADGSIGRRLKDHSANRLRSRWDRFSWFGFRGVQENGALAGTGTENANLDEVIAVFEAVLIELLEPPLNRQQGAGLVAAEYLQTEDPDRVERRRQALVGELVGKLVR